MERSRRYNKLASLAIPCSDWCTNPESKGRVQKFGRGIAHHDIVNVSFWGAEYDTAIIAHPLIFSDIRSHRGCRETHAKRLMDQLKAIQKASASDPSRTPEESRARWDSLNVLQLWRKTVQDVEKGEEKSHREAETVNTDAEGDEVKATKQDDAEPRLRVSDDTKSVAADDAPVNDMANAEPATRLRPVVKEEKVWSTLINGKKRKA